METDGVADPGGELRIVGQLEPADPVRRQAVSPPDALNRDQTDARHPAISRPLQWVVSPGGSAFKIGRTQVIGDAGTHPTDLRAAGAKGIPGRTPMFRSIH